ncbi:phosphate transport system permease protein [Amorphus suaedae]
MNNLIVIVVALVLLGFVYQLGLRRSKSIQAQTGRRLHSRHGHYGLMVVLWCLIPASIVYIVWLFVEPVIATSIISSFMPPDVAADGGEAIRSTQRIHALVSGYGVAGDVHPYEQAAAEQLNTFHDIARLALVAIVAAAGVAGALFARSRISPTMRARNEVEGFVKFVLIVCSIIAILTTVGIVLSMLGEALRFFTYVSPIDFFFGTTWNPRFSSVGSANQGEFGLLPLLWGTLMITLIAMLVAVPVGLMSAVYLSEYAGPKLRFVAKPLLEVLAGIPTIVYGFFALVTVGPFFSEVGALFGLHVQATSAFTAGVVMGVMIIPFVSSLSDDIISQVPKAMHDGSLGLGATKSETIRKVILPAALPGIVGAFLLAVSRAVGETMIVVLAAGNSPVLTANPFEAVSTVTVTIVNQLTGDVDFASPQSLVAFALGLTLFVITLGLNVVALHIVRRYREQYE